MCFFFCFFRLAMHLEANGHVVAYADTDSLLSFPTRPDAPRIEQLCQISDRLGCLKVEKDCVKKFFSTAAKTYSLETTTGEITIKAKGFNLLEKLLKDNSNECLLEKNVMKMFAGISDYTEIPDPSTLVFQKQIKVDPVQMVPALVARDKSYKLLNFIGPRRQVDLNHWLDFNFERILLKDLKQITVDPLEPFKPKSAPNLGTEFSCLSKVNFFMERSSKNSVENEKHQVLLVPKIKGILPALPYGFSLERIEVALQFYNLVK